MAKYKQITFAKGYNKSFADFKAEFESTHVFKGLQPSVRDSELKKAHKIATAQSDGDATEPVKKSKSDKS